MCRMGIPGNGDRDSRGNRDQLIHNVRDYLLLERLAQRVQDDDVMRLLRMILSVTGKKGVPRDGVVSRLSSSPISTE